MRPWAADFKGCCCLDPGVWMQTRPCRLFSSGFVAWHTTKKTGTFQNAELLKLCEGSFLPCWAGEDLLILPEVLWGSIKADVRCVLWWQAVGVTGAGGGTIFGCLLRQLKVWLDWFGLPTSPLLHTQWVFPSVSQHPSFFFIPASSQVVLLSSFFPPSTDKGMVLSASFTHGSQSSHFSSTWSDLKPPETEIRTLRCRDCSIRRWPWLIMCRSVFILTLFPILDGWKPRNQQHLWLHVFLKRC